MVVTRRPISASRQGRSRLAVLALCFVSLVTPAPAAATSTAAFLPAAAVQRSPPPPRVRQCRPLHGSNGPSGGANVEAAAATSIRRPPSIPPAILAASAQSPRQTPALTAAAAAARASTAADDDDGGEGLAVMERVGSKDVEIRLPDSFTPLERIAVSAEGDLQRIVAAYYNAAVTVAIGRCEEVEPGLFDREVDLAVLGEVFCTATSSLTPRTPDCARLLREQRLGLGQLFRYLKIHPDFRLLEVGKRPNTGFWRLYELDCPGVLNCRILERFRPDTFQRPT